MTRRPFLISRLSFFYHQGWKNHRGRDALPVNSETFAKHLLPSVTLLSDWLTVRCKYKTDETDVLQTFCGML